MFVSTSQPFAGLSSQLAYPASQAPSTHEAMLQPPQFAALVFVLTSQPFAGSLSQLAKPLSQAPITQTPERQASAAPG
ncbi:hypothetical protein BE20_17285 [Sorangium cellulosum]|nr:hypothetical protein BE20_17285 [Sorangium cellulosum]